MKFSTILFNKNLLNQPVIAYNNVEKDKLEILSDNKNLSGIYMFTHRESEKIYIGSAINLYTRIRNYYSSYQLNNWDNYISRALLLHSHSAFSLSILEYINIEGLSNEEARLLILSREQEYLNKIFSVDNPNTYNILRIAGSSLGFKHTEEAKVLISLTHSGKLVSEETKVLLSIAKAGENNPMFGKTGENSSRGMLGKIYSAETISLMKEVKSGENRPRGMSGKTHSVDTKSKISETKGTNIYVYDTQGSLVNTFNSARKAGEYFDSNFNTILKYARNGKLFKSNWILSTSLIIKD